MSKKNISHQPTAPAATTRRGTHVNIASHLGSTAVWFAIVCIILIGMGWLLVSRETELLLRAQELNLWLPTQLYWAERMVYPGGLASWIACYLTQYFYYPILGTVILCVLWLILCGLIVWVWRLRGPWVALPLLVTLALLACFTQTGYWIYYQKLQGHLFVPTVGVLFAVLCLATQRLIDLITTHKLRQWLSYIWMAVVCIAGYPLFGAWALGATALLAVATTPLSGKSLAIRLLAAVVLIAAVPQIYYQQCFDMTERDFVYVAALPSLRYGKDSFMQYRLPYFAIIAAFAIIALVGAVEGYPFAKRIKTWQRALVSIVLMAIAAIGVHAAWYRDANFHKELAMNRAIEECDWERALTYARDGSSGIAPTRQIVMYKNLALFRLGRAGDDMFLYPEGSTQQNAPWQVRMTQVGGKLIYYHYGKENFCYRWCMEDGVEFGWKAETLKFMARTSLLNHEWEVARKYINLLKKTTFHRRWAERYEPLLYAHDGLDLQKLEASVAAGKPLLSEDHMREFAPIMHMMTYPDRLDGDNTLVEMYLLQTFANGNGDDLLFQEMTLICALIMKDIDLFWPRFMRYATLNPKVHMPRYYQEAAYLYGHLENKVDISRMPFDKEIKDTYERFMQFNAQCGNMTEEQKAVAFRPQFGDTFYYFYFLVRNQKTN